MMKPLRVFVVIEAVLCFAVPTYFVFWSVLTLPLWLTGASGGAGYAAVHALCTIGGCLGLWALFRTLRYLYAWLPGPDSKSVVGS